jgi:response regulator RpfG family c-di-GMP phosphodiesterase
MINVSNRLVVFYADDDHDDLDTFRDVIEDIKNAELYTHDHGDKLIHALENPPPIPHVVFLDLNMPGKNGFEVLQELRLKRDFKELPIVILSTSVDEQSIFTSKQLGANLYLPKASNYDKLKASVLHALKIDWNNYEPADSGFVYHT